MQSIADVINAVNEILYGVHLFISTSTQAIMLTFGHNAFGKGQCTIYRPEYNLTKRHVTELIKLLTNFFYQRVSPM